MKSRTFLACILGTVILSSCGGGGSDDTYTPTDTTSNTTNITEKNPTPTGSLSGIFVDAPVAGIDYITTSGVFGTTDIEGRFYYNPGDLISFKIGNLFLGMVEGSAVITPQTLVQEIYTNPIQASKKVKEMVALLLSLDDNPNDDIIKIREDIKEKFRQLQEEIDFRSIVLENLYIDINGDGQDEHLLSYLQTRLAEAEEHYTKSMIDQAFDFIKNYVSENNITCSGSPDYNNKILAFYCPDGLRIKFVVKDGLIRVEYPSGYEYVITRFTQDNICVMKEYGEFCNVIEELKNNGFTSNTDLSTDIVDSAQDILTLYQMFRDSNTSISVEYKDLNSNQVLYSKTDCHMKNLVSWIDNGVFIIRCGQQDFTEVITGFENFNPTRFYLNVNLDPESVPLEEVPASQVSQYEIDTTTRIGKVCYLTDDNKEFCIGTF